MPGPTFPRHPGMGGGRPRGGAGSWPGNVYREASISQGLLLSEFRIKGLRREEVQRKWGVGHLVKRAVRAPRAWVLTLFPASAGHKPGHHLSDQRERLDQPEKGGPDPPTAPSTPLSSGLIPQGNSTEPGRRGNESSKPLLTWAWRGLRPRGLKHSTFGGVRGWGLGALDLMMIISSLILTLRNILFPELRELAPFVNESDWISTFPEKIRGLSGWGAGTSSGRRAG